MPDASPNTRPVSAPSGTRPARPFRLTRSFSWISLLGVTVVTIVLILGYRALIVRQMVEHESRAHADLTRAFTNAESRAVLDVLALSEGATDTRWHGSPEVRALDRDLRARMRNLSVVKVKLYDRAGVTAFSTDAAQIGEVKAGNAGIRAALRGEVVSEITRRDRFDAFEGVINHRDLIATYVPFRREDAGDVEGVFELYSDVTGMLRSQTRAQWQMAGVALGLQVALYLFLLVVVRHADRALQHHERLRAERDAQIRYQAYHDMLTGLPNRASFVERLGEVTALARRQARPAPRSALMFIDLDRFKQVNDSLGHDAGDALLREVARRLRACLGPGDQLFRMGGDEFTVLMPEIRAPEDGARLARRLNEALGAPIAVSGREVSVGASIGIAVCPDDGTEPDELLRRADAAMYGAKAQGRGVAVFHRDEMNQRARRRHELEAALGHAVRAQEFRVHYRPRASARDGHVVAVEAVLHWSRRDRSAEPPPDFMDALEDLPLMQVVGEWMLRDACAQLATWHARGHADLRVSLNVSAVQLESPGFVERVRGVLAASGVPADRLELAATETALARRPDRTDAVLAALAACGVRVAVRGFGAGHASLRHLRSLPLSVARIDTTSGADAAADERDRALLAAVVNLAHALGLEVVAEGVRTDVAAAFFRGLRCDALQGALPGAPVPPQALDAVLERAGAAVPG